MLEIVNLFNFKEVLFSFNGNAYITTVYISTRLVHMISNLAFNCKCSFLICFSDKEKNEITQAMPQ